MSGTPPRVIQRILPLQRAERDLEQHKFRGLVEHSHHALKCSACGEVLLDVMVTEPHMRYKDKEGNELGPVEFKYRADCPLCGDHSFPTQMIQGGTYIGTINEKKVLYEGSEVKGDTVFLRTVKGPEA